MVERIRRRRVPILYRAGGVSKVNLSIQGGYIVADENYSFSSTIPPVAWGEDINLLPTMTFDTPSTPTVGEKVYFNNTGYYSPSGVPEGNSIIKLYRFPTKTGTPVLLYDNSVNSFINEYTLQSEDAGYLVIQVTSVDENGQYLDDLTVTSEFSSVVQGTESLADYFDHGFDVIDSNFWQDTGKTTPASAGDTVQAIDDLIGSITLETAPGQTDATLESGYLDMTKSPVSGYAGKGYIGDLNINDAQPSELMLVLTPKNGGDTGYVFKGNGPNIRAVSPNWTIDGGSLDTVSEPTQDVKVILHLTLNGAASEWRVNNGAPQTLDIGTLSFARLTIGDDTQTKYHHWFGTYFKNSLFADAAERNAAYAFITDKHGL